MSTSLCTKLAGRRSGARRTAGSVAFALATATTVSAEEAGDDTRAVEPGVTYTGDFVGVPAGVDPGVTYMDNLDVTVTFHLDELVGWTGGICADETDQQSSSPELMMPLVASSFARSRTV